LREEAANPFRALRFFVYSASGASAAIGGLISLAQLAGSLAEAPNALPVETVTQNLAVNFGVVAAATVLWRLDAAGQEQTLRRFMAKDEESKNRMSPEEEEAQAKLLGGLPVEVVVGFEAGSTGEDMVRRGATVKELGVDAKQHVVVIAGKKPMISESLIQAQILGEKFSRQSVQVIPFDFDPNAMSTGGGKGFGKSGARNKPYVAQIPNGSIDSWTDYIDTEVSVAARQSKATRASIRDQGIVVVMNRKGQIVRRGLGVPAWSVVIDDVSGKSNEK